MKCPCGLTGKQVFVKEIPFYKCTCGLVYVKPNSTSHQSPEYDQRLKDTVVPKDSAKIDRIKKVLKRVSQDASILDFGCGSGVFLKYAYDHGYKNLYAVDVNKYALNHAKFWATVSRDIPYKKFDLIVMDNVIEHLPNPKKVLSKCRKALKKDGLLFISTPNIDSFIIKRVGQAHRHFDPAQHFVYFTPTTLVKMCEMFTLVSLETALEEATVSRLVNTTVKRNLSDYSTTSTPRPSKVSWIRPLVKPVDYVLIKLTNWFKQGAYIDAFFRR